jgi:RNA polymerase sigma factor (TIGR02999 family)
MPLVYDELRHLAAGYLRRERFNHTLQPTALVHEAYLRLIGQDGVDWQNRAHLIGIAAEMMRRILVNHARDHNRLKRGGGAWRVTLSEADRLGRAADVDLELLDSALIKLADVDPRKARVVELRFFGGLTIEETASVLQNSTAKVERDWRLARAFLRQQISRSDKQ